MHRVVQGSKILPMGQFSGQQYAHRRPLLAPALVTPAFSGLVPLASHSVDMSHRVSLIVHQHYGVEFQVGTQWWGHRSGEFQSIEPLVPPDSWSWGAISMHHDQCALAGVAHRHNGGNVSLQPLQLTAPGEWHSTSVPGEIVLDCSMLRRAPPHPAPVTTQLQSLSLKHPSLI